MKISIRFGVFETNSSSTHSATLVNIKKEKPKIPLHAGYDEVCSMEDKLVYLCGALLVQNEMEVFEAWENEGISYRDRDYYDPRFSDHEKYRGIYYETMLKVIKVYCEITKEKEEKVYNFIKKTSEMYNPLFLKFCQEDDLNGDYFSHECVADKVLDNYDFKKGETQEDAIRRYFTDDYYVLIIEK